MLLRIAAIAIALGTAACGPVDEPAAEADLGLELAVDRAPRCTFERGVTICVRVVGHVEQSTHLVYSGCMAFDGSDFVPGRRVTTYLDTYVVTETITTKQHGIRGQVFERSIDEQRTLVSSTQTGSVCEPS